MSSDKTMIWGVPANIITGFLGAGKTTAILHLLQNKPDNENWAVLVNEFGEIGIDGSLIEGISGKKQQVFIREVPGGCMCCAAGLPMQIALNLLLAEAKPDRLLIEPTGLGHPIEVMQILQSEHYREVLSLQKTLTLVDARKLQDPRYTNHETFNQQIAIADTVVGNKSDLYQDEESDRLKRYVQSNAQPQTRVILAEHGKIAFSELQGKTGLNEHSSDIHSHHHKKQIASDLPIPECGFIKASNQGEGFQSIGWRFAPHMVFNKQKLLSFMSGLQVVRMKAVFITDEGIFGYNSAEDAFTETELNECQESRIELISDHFDEFEEELFGCLDTV